MVQDQADTAFAGELADTLQSEMKQDAASPVAKASDRTTSGERRDGVPARLPRRIAGGFEGLGTDLERRSREWRRTYRLMEQQRPQLESAEAERDRLHELLERTMKEVNEANRIFKEAVERTKQGDVSSDLAPQFDRCQTSLEELENVAETLSANMLAMRSTWEQYARTILKAQKMREEVRENGAPQARQTTASS
ncbi:hypothetical protein [Pararhizobium mangrovi]|uniref:Uncharacterized protein n=1 Tax=Pararhizobium mangrovi TaxID=2590452 RepID=A0A506TV58_9HYPH|nr:hypothetical protein [Pararhizobium mangrovi]TPW25953.1 hypothetical protein FJU11_16915 [Pararhizobium mangrovi]